jgi:hypothetical protein
LQRYKQAIVMFEKAITYLVGISAICIVSCNTPRYVYTPLAANTPVFQKKGQGLAVASFGTSRILPVNSNRGPAIGGDFMGAYAIHNNIGIQGQYSFRNEKDEFLLKNGFIIPIPDSMGGSSTIRYNRNHGELGLGGFLPLNQEKTLLINLGQA